MLERWGAFVARRALWVLLAGVALVLAAGAYGSGVFDSLSQGGFDDPDSEASRELALERDTFGNRGVDAVAIYSSDDLTADSPEFRSAVEDVVAGIPEGTTSSVVTYYDTQSPDMISEDGHSVQVQISLEGDSQDALLDNWDEVEPTLEADGLETDVAGAFAVYGDVNEITSEDLARAEKISLPIVVLLALLIFGSLVAAAMPALVGALAVVGSLAVVRLITGFTEVSIFSVNVITLLGMGLAIDYALFMISRFREELAKYPVDDPDASAKAIVSTMNTGRPHRPLLRPHRRRRHVVAAGLPPGLPQEHGVRRDVGRRDRDAGRADPAAGDPAPARPQDRRRPAALAPAPPGHRRRRARLVGPARARRDAPSGRDHRRDHLRPARRGLAVPRGQVGQRRLPGAALRRLRPRRRRQAQRGVRRRAVQRQPAGHRCRRAGRRGVPAGGRGGRRHRRRPAGGVRG